MMTEPISVTALNQYVKGLLDRDRLLSQVLVRSEISNYKIYPSGHHYFTLKDAESSVRCVLFRREAARLRFRPENGMKVIVSGRVSVFPRDGAYQLYCNQMVPDGVGELAFAFEQLKNKLHRAGLFDPARKKPLPAFPHTIALVTSPAGAAVRDMIRILGARWPMAKVLVVPVRVQGAEAPQEICQALDLVNAAQLADLIITGRGGGSMEDLWAFNDENLARTIYHSAIPVISAVGHEPDVTISDFVADLRAATPSNAAELAVPDQNEVAVWLRQMEGRLAQAMGRKLDSARKDLDRAARCRALQDPMNYVDDKRMVLDYQREKLAAGLNTALNRERQRFGALASKLDALSPLKVLGRGYAIPRKADGGVVRSVTDVASGDPLKLRVADGEISCQVV